MQFRPDTLRAAIARSRVPLGPALVGLVAFAVYLRTLLPGVSWGDWAEMQTVPHVLGVAHPTGYPTYIVTAWLFELLPLGSIAFRANLLSAVLVTGTLVTLALIARRLGVRPVIAAGAALATGAVGTVWAAATVAEVNPLHLFLMAALTHRALAWTQDKRPRDLVLCGLLLGLAVGNHLLTLFVAPFLFAFAVWGGRRELWRRPVLFLGAAAATVAGLAVYAYVPIAASQNPPLPYNHPTTLDGVLWLATGTQFRGQFDFLSAKGPGEFAAALPALWNVFLGEATVVVPVLGALGLLVLVRFRPAFGLACAGILLSGLYVWANYQQLEHYLLVPFFLLGIGVAAALEWGARGLALLARRIGRLPQASAGGAAAALVSAPGTASAPPAVSARRAASAPGTVSAPAAASAPSSGASAPQTGRMDAGRATGLAAGLLGLAFAVILASLNWSASDRSGDRSGQTYIDAVFGALPANAVILSYWDPSAPLWYGHFVEGLRPDVLVVDDTNIVYEGWGTVEARIESLICQRPVYVIRLGSDLQQLRRRWLVEPFLQIHVSNLGPSAVIDQEVYRVRPASGAPCTSGQVDGGSQRLGRVAPGGAQTDPE